MLRADENEYLCRIGPSIYRQPESSFCDEEITSQMVERHACGIWRKFVIARNYPNFVFVFEPDLRRTENVARGMKGKLHTVDRGRCSIRLRFDRCLRIKSNPGQLLTFFYNQITSVSAISMV